MPVTQSCKLWSKTTTVLFFPGDLCTLEPNRSHRSARPPPQFCRQRVAELQGWGLQISDEDKRPAAKARLVPPQSCRPVALINYSSPFGNVQSWWKGVFIYSDNLKGHERSTAMRSIGKCTLPRLVFVQLGHSEEE